MEWNRIRLEQMLQDFLRNNEIEELSLPPVFGSTERSFIHKLCTNMGMISKSKGSRGSRFVLVTKRHVTQQHAGDAKLSVISKSGNLLTSQANTNGRFLATLDMMEKTLQFFAHSRWIASLPNEISFDDPYGLKKCCVTGVLSLPGCGKNATGKGTGTVSDRDSDSINACRVHDRLSLPPAQVPSFPVNNDLRNKLMRERAILPIMAQRTRIVRMIDQNQVSLVVGETGSGKSTQVPQFLLEQAVESNQKCRIIVTEPRRIAAITVAERCANERGESVGGTVGYQIRLEKNVSPKTLLTFCTNGVLLRTLIGAQVTLMNITHIIIDEVHERDRMSDFLLTVMREILPQYRHLRLILMSASLDIEKFENYFQNSAIVEVPGRLYDVEEYFLEDILKFTNYRSNRGFSAKIGDVKDENSFEDELENAKWAEEITKWEESAQSTNHQPNNNAFVPNLRIGPVTDVDALLENAWLYGGIFELDHLVDQILVGNLPVNCCHSKSGLCPISIVAGRGAMDQVKRLANLGATLDDNQMEDAKIMAYRCGHKKVIEFLNNYVPEYTGDEDKASSHGNDFAQGDSNNVVGNNATADQITATWHSSGDVDPQGKPPVSGFAILEEMKDDPDCKLLSEYFGESGDDDQIDVMLIVELMNYILTNSEYGAILVFLPGYEDLTTVRDHILMDARLMKSNLTICILHSLMMPNDQKEAFLPTPEGSRKIVLSTNIAEVSVTINDVVHVIDCGKMKERIFDSFSGVNMLSNVWISKANALQRKGRAGRCSYGYCYRLFSKLRYKYMPDNPVPEILRVPIHELCLQTKLLFPEIKNVQRLLSKAPDSPSPAILASSIAMLTSIGAMTEEENLTLLGRKLVELPADPQFAKMLLFGVLLKCIDPILTIVACLSYKDPFILPKVRDEKRAAMEARCSFSADMYSDHLVYLKAYEGWYSAYMLSYERQFCSQNFLSSSSMNMIFRIKNQLRYQLYRLGYLGTSDSEACYATFNTNRNNWPIIKAALVAGSYPCMAFVDKEKRKIRTKRENVDISIYSTVLKGKRYSASRQTDLLPTDWLVYNELVRIKRHVQIKCATAATPITVCLFSGPTHLTAADALKTVRQHSIFENWEDRPSGFGVIESEVIQIDDLVFKTEFRQAKKIIQLREKIFSLFFKMLRIPWNCSDESSQEVLSLLSDVLNTEDEHFGLTPSKKRNIFREGFASEENPDGFGSNAAGLSAGNGNGNNGTVGPSRPGSYYRPKSYFHTSCRQKKY